MRTRLSYGDCYDCGNAVVGIPHISYSGAEGDPKAKMVQCHRCYLEEIHNTPEFQRKLRGTLTRLDWTIKINQQAVALARRDKDWGNEDYFRAKIVGLKEAVKILKESN